MDEHEIVFYLKFVRTCYVLEINFYQLGCFRLQGQRTEVVVSNLVGPAAQQNL